MTARRCIFAYTKPDEQNYPEFLSLNREEDGRLTVTVRGPRREPNTEGNANPFALARLQATVTLPDGEIADLQAALLRDRTAAAVSKG